MKNLNQLFLQVTTSKCLLENREKIGRSIEADVTKIDDLLIDLKGLS